MRPDRAPGGPGARIRAYWKRHRTLFWTLHSLWAMATGVVVVVLARERYSFVPWVVLFLLLTWASTLYFSRKIPEEEDGEDGAARDPRAPGFGEEATSYLTRTMYQETLFFLLPFYAYSTVFHSLNVVFLGALGALAFVSCLDLVLDRWLRSHVVASLLFFAIVAFSALNLLLPILLPLDPTTGARVAVVVAALSAVPLAIRGASRSTRTRWKVGAATVGFLIAGLGLPTLIPPVPLRVESSVFSSDIDRETLLPTDTLGPEAGLGELQGRIVVLMEVFAPTVVPTEVALRWSRNGEIIRESREIEIVAHDLGFRIWDAWRPTDHPLEAGEYEVVVRTRANRVFGRSTITVRTSQ